MKAKKCPGEGQKFKKPRFFPAVKVSCPICSKEFTGLIPGDKIPPHKPKPKRRVAK